MSEQWLLKCPICGKTNSNRWWNNNLLAESAWVIHQRIGGKCGIETIEKFTASEMLDSENESLIGALGFLKERLLYAGRQLAEIGLIGYDDLQTMGISITFERVESPVETNETEKELKLVADTEVNDTEIETVVSDEAGQSEPTETQNETSETSNE